MSGPDLRVVGENFQPEAEVFRVHTFTFVETNHCQLIYHDGALVNTIEGVKRLTQRIEYGTAMIKARATALTAPKTSPDGKGGTST